MVINKGLRSPLPSLEAIIILHKVGLFPSHPCFDTSSLDYSPDHLFKAINEEKYVCTLQRCVNLIYLVYANSYHIPMAIVENESHTFVPSHSMIYVCGSMFPAWKIPTHHLGHWLNVTSSGNLC